MGLWALAPSVLLIASGWGEWGSPASVLVTGAQRKHQRIRKKTHLQKCMLARRCVRTLRARGGNLQTWQQDGHDGDPARAQAASIMRNLLHRVCLLIMKDTLAA